MNGNEDHCISTQCHIQKQVVFKRTHTALFLIYEICILNERYGSWLKTILESQNQGIHDERIRKGNGVIKSYIICHMKIIHIL